MAEHTVELTPDEAEGVLELAGFSIDKMKGLWLCRQQGELMDLDPTGTLTGLRSYVRRHAMATQRPQDSFLWWAEARKQADPDIPRLKKAIKELFETGWQERVSRIRVLDGVAVTLDDGRTGVAMRRGQEGYAMVGPQMALPAGEYEFAIEMSWSGSHNREMPLARYEVLAGDDLFSSTMVFADQSDGSQILLATVSIPDLRFGVHIRLFCTGASEIRRLWDCRFHLIPGGDDLSVVEFLNAETVPPPEEALEINPQNDHRISILLFLGVLAVYLAVDTGQHYAYDGQVMIAVSMNLVNHGSLTTVGALNDVFHMSTPYSPYGIGMSLLGVFPVALSKFFGH